MRGVTTVGKLYSDTCGYCVEMAPAWEQMENNINGKQTKFKTVIKFHNIEANQLSDDLPMLNKTLVGQKVMEPNAFPTLYKHENGKVSYYQGAREVEPMTKWVMGSPKKNMTKGRRVKSRRRGTRGKR
jgi:hypothetical protein